MKTKEYYQSLNIKRTFYSAFMKRFLDFMLSLIAIIILSPILLLLYLLNVIFVGFPAIYKQSRPGKNFKTFNIYKFRSMNNKKDKNGNLLPDSQRITLWGKIMRKTSLDELPQLFNILKGDMSFVGPRPRLVKDVIFYDEYVLKYYFVRPGLTGPTQTTGRNQNTWEQVFEKDVEYVKNNTFWNDVKIFFKTFLAVFKSTGETHTNAEEDKTEVKEQEYYYADYIKRIQKISEEQYNHGIQLANDIIKNKKQITFHPELHDHKLLESVIKEAEQKK